MEDNDNSNSNSYSNNSNGEITNLRPHQEGEFLEQQPMLVHILAFGSRQLELREASEREPQRMPNWDLQQVFSPTRGRVSQSYNCSLH
jgi:hypothetical protein